MKKDLKQQNPTRKNTPHANTKTKSSGINANSKDKNHSKYINYLLIAGIIFITLIVFSRSMGHQFLNWDDDQLVYDSPYVKAVANLGLSGAIHKFGIDFFQNNPISFCSHAITYKIWGVNPKPYFAINVLIHLMNTLLVFFFIKKLSGRIEAAMIVTLLFALHPLRVESVAWATERKDVLYSFFYLCGLVSYLQYLSEKKIKWLLITLLFFPLSSFSKFAGVTFPFALIIIDIYFKRGFIKNVILEKIPFLIILALAGLIEFSSQNASTAVSSITVQYSFVDRLFFANYALVFYVVKFFLPMNLSALYPYPTKVAGSLPSEFYLSPIFVLVIFALAIFLIYKSKNFRNELLFGFLFFLLNIFLVLHFMPFGGNIVVADRYTYMAHIGLCFVFGQLYVKLSDEKHKMAKPFLGLIIITALIFTVATWKRVEIFKDSFTLFSDVIEKEPKAGVAYSNRGLTKEEKKDYVSALQDYDKAIELIPNYLEARINRGNTRKALKDYKGSMDDFSVAIGVNPKYPVAYNNRGNLKSDMEDFPGAIEDYTKAIELNPEYAEPYHNRGLIKSKNLKKFDEAMPDFNKALELKPDYKEAYNNRGVAKFEMKDFEGSIKDISKVIELDPKNSLAYLIRGHAKLGLKQMNEACADWQKSLQLGNQVAAEMIKQNCK